MKPPASSDDNANCDDDRSAFIMKETLSPLDRDDNCKIKKTRRESDDGDEIPKYRPQETEETQKQKTIG